MSIVKYRPHATFVSPFNTLVHEVLGRDIGQFLGSDDVGRNRPEVNIVERETEFHLSLLAPGYSKEDLKINVEQETLTISAEKKTQELKENERFTRREFSHTAFSRGFRLPETVNTERISAEYTDGVLHVHIPKAEVTKPRTREITIA
jgi:HSP20 family protein